MLVRGADVSGVPALAEVEVDAAGLLHTAWTGVLNLTLLHAWVPWGGAEAMLGNNPFAVAFPAGEEPGEEPGRGVDHAPEQSAPEVDPGVGAKRFEHFLIVVERMAAQADRGAAPSSRRSDGIRRRATARNRSRSCYGPIAADRARAGSAPPSRAR